MVARVKMKPCAFVVRNFVMTNYLWERQSGAKDREWGEILFHLCDSN